jgi:hypothetical protein
MIRLVEGPPGKHKSHTMEKDSLLHRLAEMAHGQDRFGRSPAHERNRVVDQGSMSHPLLRTILKQEDKAIYMVKQNVVLAMEVPW